MVINPLITKLLNKKLEIDPPIGEWFRSYRESYNWPPGTGRKESELIIRELQSSIQSAIIGRDEQKFTTSLEELQKSHRTKRNI
mgnify:CR=1 FL=1